jgi:outer membrane protein insertion porin family
MLAASLVAVLAASAAPVVRDVRVEGTEDERRRLERYVELERGAPLDADTVRHAVDLIYATGAYADVRVETAPVEGGVDVVVRPIPGPLMSDLRVDRASPMNARAVRELVRFRPREPLWPQRLDSAAQAVGVRLADEGYLEALVTAEAVPASQGAEAVFHVRPGPRARVRSVSIAGLPDATSYQELAQPVSGNVWRRARARGAAEAIKKRLVQTGYWRAAVRPVDRYDPTSAAVDLVFEVDPGPRMDVQIEGGEVAGRLREAVVALLRENGALSDAVDEAVDRLEESLRLQGHREARVSVREETADGETRVVFTITPGPVSRVASVRVTGDAQAPAVALLTRAGEPLRDRALDEDVRALSRALQDDGHLDARVDAEAPETPGEVPVSFRLRAGPRTEVASVHVATVPGLETLAHRELRTKAGQPYRPRDAVADRNALLTACRNAGFLQAEVQSRLELEEGRRRVDLTFDVVPGPRTEVDHIVIAGLTHTREEIVRRELQLREGDPLGLETVLESQRRLGSLGLFGNVTISEIDPESVGHRSLLVSVDELALTRLAYGAGYSERDGPRLSAEVGRRNIGGRDRSLTTFVRGSFRGLRILSTYREPYLFGRRQELFVTAFREEEERDTFDYTRYGVSVEAARRLSSAWSVIGRFTLQQTHSFNLGVALEEIDKQYLDSFISGPSFSLVNDTRDDQLDPHHGRFLSADTQLSHHLLGGDSFVKGFVQGSLYRRLDRRVVLALNARVGLARTLEGSAPDRLPFPDRFFAGGDYSLRGFRIDRVGPLEPSSSGALVPTGGNALLLGGAELRLPVIRYFAVAGFAEAGNVYPLVDDIDLGDMRYTAGVGLRYKSAFGPIRVDWGYKLNRRDGEEPWRFHFTIGHAF